MLNAIRDFAERDLERFEARLERLLSGNLRTGTTNGTEWTETTADEIVLARAKVVELRALLQSDEH